MTFPCQTAAPVKSPFDHHCRARLPIGGIELGESPVEWQPRLVSFLGILTQQLIP